MKPRASNCRRTRYRERWPAGFWGGLLAALLVACSAEKLEAAQLEAGQLDAGQFATSTRASSRASQPARALQAGPRVAQVRGALSAFPWRAGDRLPLGQGAAALDAEAEVSLAFDVGAEVRLLGPALFGVPEGRRPGLLLREGTLGLDLERTALHPGSGFWLTTRVLRVELVQGGRVVLRAFASGATRLAVISGRVLVRVRGQDLATARTLRAPQTLEVGADGTTVAQDALVRPHFEAILSDFHASPARAGAQAAVEAEELVLARLRAACERVEANRAENQRLLAEHRSLLGGDASAAAMALQGRLAQHGQQVLRDREALAHQLSFLEARSLGEPLTDAVRLQTARAQALLR